MSPHSIVRRRPGGRTLLALAATAVGLILIAVAVAAQVRTPQPPRSAGSIDPPTASPSPSARPTGTSPSASPARSGPVPLGASRPVTISIPSIGVRSRVVSIGLAPDGTLAVPQPGPDLDKAAWFQNSPTPGQPGPAIIEGHVDSASGPSIFLDLGRLRPGNVIHVTRADGIRVTFTVNAIRDYKKATFPTEVVYGAKDLSVPQLRLITCSDFDTTIRHHTGNAVVFAHLTSIHRS